MRKKYENPGMETVVINSCDVICASGDENKGNNQNVGLNFGDQTWSGDDVD